MHKTCLKLVKKQYFWTLGWQHTYRRQKFVTLFANSGVAIMPDQIHEIR